MVQHPVEVVGLHPLCLRRRSWVPHGGDASLPAYSMPGRSQGMPALTSPLPSRPQWANQHSVGGQREPSPHPTTLPIAAVVCGRWGAVLADPAIGAARHGVYGTHGLGPNLERWRRWRGTGSEATRPEECSLHTAPEEKASFSMTMPVVSTTRLPQNPAPLTRSPGRGFLDIQTCATHRLPPFRTG